MAKTANTTGLHDLAQAYVDNALKLQEAAGSPAHLSPDDYKAVVQRAEDALRGVVPSGG